MTKLGERMIKSARKTRLRLEEEQAEIDRLRAIVLDVCRVLDEFDLPEQAIHYRRKLEAMK
jgi:hypothetical protein